MSEKDEKGANTEDDEYAKMVEYLSIIAENAGTEFLGKICTIIVAKEGPEKEN